MSAVSPAAVPPTPPPPDAFELTPPHSGGRLDPRIGDRDYLHLAPLAAILRSVVGAPLASGGLRVLDLGCGAKPYASLFAGRSRYYVGIDVQRPSAAEILGVGEYLPFADSAFDLVLCTQVLEHDPEPQRTVDEAYRVLAKGGLLVLSTHGVWFKHGEADYWRWTDAGLRKVMRSFDRVDVHNCGGQYSCLFQILNLYADPVPLGRRFLYLVNNILGVSLDRILPAENLIVNYVVVARK
jgi:SAM-dependent methyltransferase